MTARPQEVVLCHTLGQLLTEQKPPRWAEAVEFYRAARGLRPDLGLSLANALKQSDRDEEGLALLSRMVDENPRNPNLRLEQGYALDSQKKFAEAETAYREAISLKPDYAWAYNNLGVVPANQRKSVEAEAAYRKAIALKPDEFAWVYINLGGLLTAQGEHVKAEAVWRKVLEIMPELSMAYLNIGSALTGQVKHAEAEAAYRTAISITPNGAALHYSLGYDLHIQKKPLEAEAAYRKAIALNPDYAEPHCNLGAVLQLQGRFTESLTARRRGHELGSKRSGWRYSSLQWVRDAESMVELEKKLPANFQGEASLESADDAITFAWMCQRPYKKRHAASSRLYSDAFTVEPKLATDLNRQHRYNAACSAALAAAGEGNDALFLPDRVAAMFRLWALSWLRDDLAVYAKVVEQNNPAANKTFQQTLTHWRRDPDLVSVRDPQMLDRLPDNERAAWQALWRDVDELLKRVAK